LATGNWSADGSHLIYTDQTPAGGVAIVVASDGRDPHEIKGIEGTISWMVWTPDAKKIYITSISSNNSCRRRLAQGPNASFSNCARPVSLNSFFF
jgi:hypothetical protein